MAAVQCRNSKCTAEKKGFRLKLDSWRHKLIHCVGFESILEGIYGPMLLKDINIFDDCEPEELDNWSMDASCSFCTLQLDKLSDHVPAAASPLSPPSEDTPTLVPSLLDSNQSAHRFLHKVFHKKDVPLSSCDPNVPLVAQELMKKMIHQFALEYASKSPLYASRNGHTLNGVDPGPSDPDAPLDLTVSRSQDSLGMETQPEGVLDLSRRTSATSLLTTNQESSGLLLPTVTEESECKEDAGTLDTITECKSALQAVLQMLCPAHRSLLQQILTLAYQEHCWSIACTHCQLTQAKPHCCHRAVEPQDGASPPPLPFDKESHSRATPYPFSDCNSQTHNGAPYLSLDCNAHSHTAFAFSDSQAPTGSCCCCVQSCRLAAYPVGNVRFCLKSLQCLSCQSLAIGRINKVICPFTSLPPSLGSTSKLCPSSSVCPASAICCSSHNAPPCPCYSEHARLAQGRHSTEAGGEGNANRDPQCPVLTREQTRSPSPPPLSPIPSDINGKDDEKPPSLLHHRDEGKGVQERYVECDKKQGAGVDKEIKNYPPCRTLEQSHTELNPSGSLLQDVVDRFSEKLETIKPQEKDPPSLTSLPSHSLEKDLHSSSSVDQSLESQTKAQLSEIITKCLHSDNNSDYNLSELFYRHNNNENQTPETRSWRKERKNTPNQPFTWRDTVKIKRDLARFGGRKRSSGRNGKSKDGPAVPSPPTSSSSEISPVKEEIEEIGKNRQVKKMGQDCEKAKVSEEESVTVGVKDTLTGEIERETETGETSKINVGGSIKSETEETQGGQVLEGSVERFSKEAQWVAADEGERNSVTEEIKAVTVIDEVKMERMTEENVTIENGRSPDNQTSTTAWQQNGTPETVVKHESETSSSDKVCDQNSEILRTHSEFTPIHSDATFARMRGQCKRGRPERKEKLISQQGKSRRNIVQRSRRNIVPPQRFSSYVTEPRKMYFAACFSESIFSQRISKDRPVPDSESDPLSSQTVSDDSYREREESLQSTPHLERQENNKNECQPGEPPQNSPIECKSEVVQVTVASAEKSPSKHSMQKRTDVRDRAARPYGRLRSSPTNRQNSESKSAVKSLKNLVRQDGVCTTDSTPGSVESQNPQPLYTSPIKLMFVSPVVGKDGVKYTLRSAASNSSGQGEETFDPCEDSSWAGTPEKNKSPPAELVASPPKRSPTKSGEGTPIKQVVGTDTHRSPGSLNGIGGDRLDSPQPFHETTPPKRRPGRPKKLGPQLEKRAKRPIGRPPKQKCLNQACGPGTNGVNVVNPNGALESDKEDKPNKNLKITVVYGRSRRSKRLVSEDSGCLQTSILESPEVESRTAHVDKTDLCHSSQVNGNVKGVPLQSVEDFNFVRPVKDRKVTPHSSSNIKCQKLIGAVPMRKPGRPAKVKISGISVTVTTVSPRQRKIHISRDSRESSQIIRKKLQSEFQPSKEPRTISVPTSNNGTQSENEKDSKDERKERPVPVRYSVRVRKPSVYLLHSVATSRSYSHSTALLRRSRQLLLNKASSQRKQEEAQGAGETSGPKPHLLVQAGKWNARKQVCQDLSHVAAVSVDSIFSPSDTLRWWPVSTKEETLNQELARRIRLVSDTWISDTHKNLEGTSLKSKVALRGYSTSAKARPEPTSMVRMLFDCPPSKPRSCSMGQLCSWFMQTTETQSLAIVKKASNRNPYEVMHYPRVASRGSVCPSPQAERLHKHVKKFAKAVPKSPTQHRQAQERLWNRRKRAVKHQLFTSTGRLCQRAQLWKGRGIGKYLSNLLRVKSKFLTRRERLKRPKKHRNQLVMVKRGICANKFPEQVKSSSKLSEESFSSTTTNSFDENIWPASPSHLTEEVVDIPKEQRLSSKAWSPETLKECRVFLKKINSPDTESTAEEDCDTCTVMLDDGSPSAYCPDGRRADGGEREEENKAVKMQRKKRRKKRSTTKESDFDPPIEILDQSGVRAGKRESKQRSLEVVSSEPLLPPPGKVTRQSRGRGLTGPKWRDFVVGSSK